MTSISYSLEKAAEESGLSKSYLSNAIKVGDLAAKQSGVDKDTGEPVGKYLIRHADLEKFIDGLVDA